jgi:putative peptidoglycan lipid II flippase
MAALFGAGTTLDAFIVAFRIPNLARQLFGEGALTTAFLPIFLRERDTHGDDAARRTLVAVTFALAALLTGVVLLGELGLLWAIRYAGLTEASRLLLVLLAILLPYMVLICMAALFSAALHALHMFLWPALVPAVLNLCWLTGVAIAWRSADPDSLGVVIVAVSVTLAGVLQMLIPAVVLARHGMSPWGQGGTGDGGTGGRGGKSPMTNPQSLMTNESGEDLSLGIEDLSSRNPVSSARPPCSDAGWPRVREIFLLMLPVIAGITVMQLNTVLDSFMAWGLARPDDGGPAWSESLGIPPLVESGTATALYLGQRMYQFPLGIFGIALGTVLYPVLTQHAQRGEFDALRTDLTRGLRLVVEIGLPASAGLAVLSGPLASLLFRHGQFDAEDARFASRMIAVYGSGVWVYIGLAIVNRAFYATGDRMTPVRLGSLALTLNVLLNVLLVWLVGGIGLALGSVLAALFQLSVTTRRLNRQVGRLAWGTVFETALRGLAATLAMAAVCGVLLARQTDPESVSGRLVTVLTLTAVGVGVYLLLAKWLGLREIFAVLRREADG